MLQWFLEAGLYQRRIRNRISSHDPAKIENSESQEESYAQRTYVQK